MSLKEKLMIMKKGVLSSFPTEKQLPATHENTNLTVLNEIDDTLDLLLKEEEKGSLVKAKKNYVNEIISLIILLDVSGSMRGTENDIYQGLKSLINKHKDDNILLSFIAFNDDRYTLLDDAPIDIAHISKIDPIGGTNLNGSLFYALNEKCSTGINLLVTISDGDDTENKITTDKVRKALRSKMNSDNHFFFLGEANIWQTPEDVYQNAHELGFEEEHIAVFTRKGNGNKLNFAVISNMLEELIYNGMISNSWSEPIKEHYLALTDKRLK